MSRLPGIRFELQAPSVPGTLPRMDVAAFVGFAASGPLHRPVAVEDVEHFRALFGEDLPLAVDPQTREIVHAHLGSAVRDFFRNGGQRCWVVRVARGDSASSNRFPIPGLFRRSTSNGEHSPAFARARSEGSWSDPLQAAAILSAEPLALEPYSVSGPAAPVELTLCSPTGVAPGDMLRVRFDSPKCTVFLPVEAVAPVWPNGSATSRGLVRARGEHPVWLDENGVPGSEVRPDEGARGVCERLTLELRVRRGAEPPLRMKGLGLCPQHPRYWSALPTDAEWARLTEGELPFTNPIREDPRIPPASALELHERLRAETLLPRFPLAGQEDGDEAIYFPLGMEPLSERYTGRELPDDEPGARARDGLQDFHARLFLDKDLLATGLRDLPGTADFLRYQSAQARELEGLHALFSKPDVTLVAVPDAIHRTWKPTQPEPIEPPLDPDKAPPIPWETFLDCRTRELSAPSLWLEAQSQPESPPIIYSLPGGVAFTLSWTPNDNTPDVLYTLEESSLPYYGDATPLYQGPATSRTLHGRGAGTYYYRVRSERGGLTSAWSTGVAVSIAPAPRWELECEEDYSPTHLLAIQRALLRLCAARGDLLALLSLPGHYREDEAIAHAAALRAPLASEEQGVPPLGFDESSALSHGALYHPWIQASGEDVPLTLRRTPPDGAACGMVARRTLDGGTWLAPANEPWRGVVALTPPLSRARWPDLQEAQVNTVLQEPRGFLTLSESTLAVEPELVPIHVRRLLALLRRAALRLGATYVFEPHDASFRRLVQRGFEDLLGTLFLRGAFAGPGPESAFQVVAGPALNTPASAEQGRFFVELKVAPSMPLTFLTVRLVQGGDRGLVTEER